MLYNSARFLLVFIFIHDNDEKRPFTHLACSQRTKKATDRYELDSVVVMFMNCLCLSIFWKIAEFIFSLVSHGLLTMEQIPMILGSVFLDVAVIRHDRTNLCNQCVFRFNTEASINGVSCPVSMRSKLERSVARDISLIVSKLKQSWSLPLV